MPIYEYICRACGCAFEELVSMASADERRACPRCGVEEAQRRLSRFAMRVSGGGASSGGKSCAGCTRSSCANC